MCTHPFEVECVIPADEVDSSAPPTIKKDHRIWTEFKTAREADNLNGKPGDNLKGAQILDFSYAGFEHGEEGIPPASGRTFDVTTFGAIPDDLKDDRPAVKLAIEAATAWRNEQTDDAMAIVFFPPGTFHLSEVEHEYDTLKIEGDYIVIKGSGSGGPLKTVLDVKFSPAPADAAANAGRRSFLLDWRVKTKSLFSFQRNPPRSKGTVAVTYITANAKKGDMEIYVNDSSKIRDAANTDHSQHADPVKRTGAGGQIWLKLNEPHAANSRLLDGLPVDSKWHVDNYLQDGLSGPKGMPAPGMPVKERHQVDEVPTGKNMIRLNEPLMCDIYEADGWSVGLDGLTPGWGVEDLCLDGGWDEGNTFLDESTGEFSHHYNWVSDLGWQMISFEYGYQPYVRRTLIKDVTGKPITFENCFGGSSAWLKCYTACSASASTHHSRSMPTSSEPPLGPRGEPAGGGRSHSTRA